MKEGVGLLLESSVFCTRIKKGLVMYRKSSDIAEPLFNIEGYLLVCSVDNWLLESCPNSWAQKVTEYKQQSCSRLVGMVSLNHTIIYWSLS